jgi:hypothetical protein
MEGTNIHIGESGKVKEILEMLNYGKIFALVMGVISILAAAYYGFTFSFIWAGYSVVGDVINLMAYTRIDEYVSAVKSRDYGRIKDDLMLWMVLTLVFGLVAGIFLLIAYINLDELSRVSRQESAIPPPP